LADLHALADTLAAAEAEVPNLRAGCEKRIIWAAGQPARTPVSLLYIHGFSATAEELRPLPDLVAQGLGANLHFTRLTGHGQDGTALGQATLADWNRDVAAALDIAATIGERVIVMGCSTGCTLATLALANGAAAAGMIHVSPNFGLRHRAAQLLLDLPGARHWGHHIVGKSRSFEAISDAHAAYWTLDYPTQALYPMADAVRAVRRADLACVATPAVFAFCDDDQVVHAGRTRAVINRWGAPTEVVSLVQSATDDAMGHLMAGNIFSPGQTAPLARRLLAWARAI
jgi:esterase/lipase